MNFVQEGTYVKRGEIMRRKQIAQDLENDPLAAFGGQLAGSDKAQEEKLNAYGEPMLVLKRNNNFSLKPAERVPELEWWDEFFLPPSE